MCSPSLVNHKQMDESNELVISKARTCVTDREVYLLMFRVGGGGVLSGGLFGREVKNHERFGD